MAESVDSGRGHICKRTKSYQVLVYVGFDLLTGQELWVVGPATANAAATSNQ